jgi:polysaccharide export outer membrane protein
MKKSTWYFLLAFLVSIYGVTANADDQLHKRPRYILRSGDTIELIYRVTPEFNQTITIQPDGFVDLNVVGDMKLTGLSVDEARARILEKASEHLNHPELNIVLKDFEKSYVVVAGEVERPGRFDLRENTTALQAILMAGGFKASGYDTNVYLFRRINGDDSEVRKLNLHDIEKTADLERDTQLQPGDMLLIPRNKLEKFTRIMKSVNVGMYFDPVNLAK